MPKNPEREPSRNATELPEILPVFPLTGSLLLPGNWLPLNVFEPRYRNMVEDAMAAERIIGMIQPLEPQPDNRPLPGAERATPELYRVGCAGRIEECQKTPDGRYVIALLGVHRFRVEREMTLSDRGYRRVEASYEAFSEAPAGDSAVPASRELLEAVTAFAEAQGLGLDMERLAKLPERVLVNGLAVALPFAPAEKQALLEHDEGDRRQVLLSLLRMGLDPAASPGEPPVAN